MDYAKLKATLSSLITDATSSEDAEKIGAIAQMVETAETEHNELLTKSEELRVKYIEAVKNSSFAIKPNEEIEHEKETQTKTLEECIADTISKRK